MSSSLHHASPAPTAASSSSSTTPSEYSVHTPPTDGITQVTWSPSTNSPDLLLASSWDKSLRLYDTHSNHLKLQLDYRCALLDAAFDGADERKIVGVGLDATVHLADVSTGAKSSLTSSNAHTGTIRCVLSHIESQQLFTGGWDTKLCAWDTRASKCTAVTVPAEGQKIYTMGMSGNRLIVGTSNRHVLIYDIRSLSLPEQKRESSLLNQTRCIRGFPDTTGYTLSSIEGRVAVEYFNPEKSVQANKYAFKCHRKTEGKTQILYPVNAMAFHPKYGTFATGGCDGLVNIWDGANKKRICQYPVYPTSIAALNFNVTGEKLAVAASYTWEEGEKDHPADAIFIRTVHNHEVLPKQRTSAASGTPQAK